MARTGFPPIPAYPIGLDTDRTLYLVYNTTESQLSVDNQAWSESVDITPVGADASEIWAENGYANIDGELFYYDAVDTDVNDKVNKLLRCARNLGGTHTKFNKAGIWVRGFVVAEHHNQLVDTLLSIEEFVGKISSEDPETIDYRIRRLEREPECLDDFKCVDVDFKFDVVSEITLTNPCELNVVPILSPCKGTEVNYSIGLNGSFTSFRLDFGDGDWTTALSGTHTYPPNTTLDPVITVVNEHCQVVQTANSREANTIPSAVQQVTPTIPLIDILIPDIIIPSFTLPSVTLTFPPIVTQCISIPDFASAIIIDIIGALPSIIVFDNLPDIPSIITFGGITVPSIISFGAVYIPDTITFGAVDIPDTITFGAVDIPDTITFGAVDIPDTIEFVGYSHIPSRIEFYGTESFSLIPSRIVFSTAWYVAPGGNPWFPSLVTISGLQVPSIITMSWLEPPTMSVVVTCSAPGSMLGPNPSQDGFEGNNVEVEVGIPSEINLRHDLPRELLVKSVGIPEDIEIVGLEIPKEISIVGNIPKSIFLEPVNIPSSIKLDASDLPTTIKLEMIMPIISLDASGLPSTIKVEGIPDTIEIKGFIPSVIELRVPENMEVPLVYKGGPIPVQFDMKNLTGEGQDLPCFAIIPCAKK
jgi:hypothetical protein